MANIGVESVPTWKTRLLEKKRRQEKEVMRKHSQEDLRLSKMPEWKQNILKKRQHGNSSVFLATDQESNRVRKDSNSSVEISPRSAASNSSSNDAEVEGTMLNHSSEADTTEEPEHLLPLDQNPWLRTDPQHRRHQRPNSRNGSSIRTSGSTSSIVYDKQFSSENDDVFAKEDGTFEYGQGFVHKLLKRFTNLGGDDSTQHHLHAKRSHSADNLLDDGPRSSTLPRSRSTTDRISSSSLSRGSYSTLPGPSKTRSVDNLLDARDEKHLFNGDFPDSHYNTDSGSSPAATSPCVSPRVSTQPITVSTTETLIVPDELPPPNTVSSTRSLFESAATKKSTVFSSLRKSKSHDVGLVSGIKRSTSPNLLMNGDVDTNDNVNTGTTHHNTGTTHHNTGNGVMAHSKSEDNVLHINVDSAVVEKRQTTEESIKNIRAAGRSWYFTDHGSKEVRVNRFDSDNNSNFTNESTHSSGVNSTYSSHPQDHRLTTDSSIAHNNEINNRINASDLDHYKTESISYNNANNDYKDNSTTSETHHLYKSHKLSSDTGSAIVHEGNNIENLQKNQSSVKAVRPSSLPQSSREEVLREGDSVSVKKTAPKPPTYNTVKGQGKLLVRPATNVVPKSNGQSFKLNEYDNITVGKFKPARRTIDDVPVTNIDDIDDVPFTNIDDVNTKSYGRSETDADKIRKANSRKYDFIGGGVTFGRSLLNRSGRGKTVRLQLSVQTLS